MNTRFAALLTLAIGALASLEACSPIALSPNVASEAVRAVRAGTQSHLYAFAPNEPLLAIYNDRFAHVRAPLAVLQGNETQLSTGNGMAVDSDGTIYFVVYSGSSAPLEFLAFAPGAQGNVAPERTAVLKGPVLAGHANGLALDGHGNFWVSAIGKLLRYSTSAQRTARPNASIALKLQTPDGLMPANGSNVAVDSAGHVYCSCTVVYRGAQAIGVSEYAVDSHGKGRLVRSFYDFNLPEVPPSSIAVDPSGTIYLASSWPNSGIYAYRAGTNSGKVEYTRRFINGSDTNVYSLATDAAGEVYAAEGARILVFGANANGHVRPIRTINDPEHLDYANGDYGTLLEVR
jgi:sugar lactone lactonase YvrE